ncbi:hypothetical protein RJ639_002367 [Escallonia herrerae]|uniref:Uncharacterized protein n=1 Tax=Escallonia herrerae TaxID=1293975 RepID=A0AA88X939_9ASTE|nr:hypothetical protein RJ639_002367 [Escallonia herrerae]
MGGQMNGVNGGGGRGDDEQDGVSVHSPCKAPPSSASSLRKEQSQVELELRLLEALEIYPPVKLRGKTIIKKSCTPYWFEQSDSTNPPFSAPSPPKCYNTLTDLSNRARVGIHRHFVLYGLTEYLRRSFNRHFSPSDVLQLMDRFYNLEMLKPDDEETEILNQEEDFCLPESYFIKEES